MWIYNLNLNEIREILVKNGFKEFVSNQVFQWLYQKTENNVDNWSNISKNNRERIKKIFNLGYIDIREKSADGEGTKKYLFELSDRKRIESVLIREKNHYTFCISTQVGCALGCKFCATGKMGLIRNLSSGEILNQILLLKKELNDYKGKINLVFMGMGEPLLNYDNLRKSLNIITDENGIMISQKNITVSTAGILENIKKLESDFPNIKISFSLNASSQQMREYLMPVSKKEKLEDILNYLKNRERKHRITFEYVLIKGVNDRIKDAKNVVKLIKGIKSKINIIPYNENELINFETPDNEVVEKFQQYLIDRGFTVIVRWSKGREIKSACGQLATKT